MKTNRLKNEQSPYLLQHALNPVDWYSWGEEAFDRARKEDRPVFVSIGYSTCHWCHVMESESFEDDDVAALMNDSFISIKVDREERPDIDNLYMGVCQLMRRHCGWPLNVVLTPDKKPFYVGTYIPKESRYQVIGMLELIPRIADLWQTRRQDVEDSARDIANSLGRSVQNARAGESLGPEVLNMATNELISRFDQEFGGFGVAPKFPSPHNLLFLLQRWRRAPDVEVLQMVTTTLSKMADGGIFDHVGSGFHRYSTDREWLLPHFEKMLYDQAMLLMAYSEAYKVTGNQQFHEVARAIGAYVLRDLTGKTGGFYSAEDADSEGVEGKFYVWTTQELSKFLDHSDLEYLHSYFGARDEGNFKEEVASGHLEGANILARRKEFPRGHDDPWHGIRDKLFTFRQKRVRPAKDDKVLTDWNGLMIAAFARSSALTGLENYLNSAINSANFIITELTTPEGRLYHRWRNGVAGIEGTAPDYAFLIYGLIELYQQTLDVKWLSEALRFNRMFVKLFNDRESGGFFFTAEDGEKLLVRQKDFNDGALPSANAIALINLLRLAKITGNSKHEKLVDALLQQAAALVLHRPSSSTGLLLGYDQVIEPSVEVVIVGERGTPDTELMIRSLRDNYAPHIIGVFKSSNEFDPVIEQLAPFTVGMAAEGGLATAFVCHGHTCRLPTTEVDLMVRQIQESISV